MKSKIALFFAATFFLFLLAPRGVLADAWYYPMDRPVERPSLKGFGQLIDEEFYQGKENLFPNKFYGYHTGIDLEIFPDETSKEVPVFAVSAGTISFVGPINGYGGLILEKIDNENITALYGHLKLKSTNLKTGDSVSAGEKIALLGDAFSSETGGERKHLHFGIYKGTGLYFKGHENKQNQLETKWENPLEYLKEKEAISPQLETETPKSPPKRETSQGVFSFILEILRSIFNW